jgi:hypothetical protein
MNMQKTRQKSVKKGALDLKVKIIDWTPINKAISDKVGEQVECRLGKGFIEGVEAIFDKELGYEEIKSLIIDNECCGRKTEKQNFYISELNDGVPFCINFFSEVGFYKLDKETENGKSISMFPSYEFSIDVDDVKKCLTGEEKSLFEFMGNRYGYNPRIISNEMQTLGLVYYLDSINGKQEWAESEMVDVTWD